MADVAELLVQAAVGLSSGALGALASGHVNRRRYQEEQADKRLVALWGLERVLRLGSEHVVGERRRQIGPTLMDAENAALPYYHTLPPELQKALEDGLEIIPGYTSPMEESDQWSVVGRQLRDYLERTSLKDHRYIRRS